jgi:hypothetical protein
MSSEKDKTVVTNERSDKPVVKSNEKLAEKPEEKPVDPDFEYKDCHYTYWCALFGGQVTIEIPSEKLVYKGSFGGIGVGGGSATGTLKSRKKIESYKGQSLGFVSSGASVGGGIIWIEIGGNEITFNGMSLGGAVMVGTGSGQLEDLVETKKEEKVEVKKEEEKPVEPDIEYKDCKYTYWCALFGGQVTIEVPSEKLVYNGSFGGIGVGGGSATGTLKSRKKLETYKGQSLTFVSSGASVGGGVIWIEIGGNELTFNAMSLGGAVMVGSGSGKFEDLKVEEKK